MAKLGHLEYPDRTSRLFGKFAMQQGYLLSQFDGFCDPLISHPGPAMHGPSPQYSGIAAIALCHLVGLGRLMPPKHRAQRFIPINETALREDRPGETKT
ncbi:hypothetical protein [Mesorhizobium sp.]|uniref:hypothetical protein n=1 Tax=Mesorhizobium sp. TaxID=1871066 RepID=UPI000FE7E4A0|nr:hypothetical protein [Mesorhizobium sp.]RWC28399.1 MAG: hypothetical protein EOS27_18715 [Mesorhizobium sp.]TIX20827.1 MAG: hypothetical protein E5V35_31490 [Mesorhizobium sp.]